mmetsp:Transcript_43205/g.133474  ORF Transcript_43205/g.133474 Transcript_43205/m.133474 type:complete len:193 (-) Transcript_43205:147-725(-)
MASFDGLARYMGKYAATIRPPWQTLVFREPTMVRHRAPGLVAFDQWKRFEYDGAVARAHHNRTTRRRAGADSPPLGVYTLPSFNRIDDARDAGGAVGASNESIDSARRTGQAPHPSMIPLDHVHHMCIARGIGKPIGDWPFQPHQCGAWHERAQVEVALGMIFAHALALRPRMVPNGTAVSQLSHNNSGGGA